MSVAECVVCRCLTAAATRIADAPCPACVMCPDCTVQCMNTNSLPTCIVDLFTSFVHARFVMSRPVVRPPCVHGHTTSCLPVVDMLGTSRAERRAAFLAGHKPGEVQWLPSSLTSMDAICPHCKTAVPVGEKHSMGIVNHLIDGDCPKIGSVFDFSCSRCQAAIETPPGTSIAAAFRRHGETACPSVCFTNAKTSAVICTGSYSGVVPAVAEAYAVAAAAAVLSNAPSRGRVITRLLAILETPDVVKRIAGTPSPIAAAEGTNPTPVDPFLVTVGNAIRATRRLYQNNTVQTNIGTVVERLVAECTSEEAALRWLEG